MHIKCTNVWIDMNGLSDFFVNHGFHKLAECQWADHVEYCIQGVKAMSKITI